MNITATLEAIYSERDLYGNCYWAMRYTDHESGKQVVGTISGGESNIYAIVRESGEAKGLKDWDRSIAFRCDSMKKREFKRLTSSWPYAGCTPADLHAFIQKQLARATGEST